MQIDSFAIAGFANPISSLTHLGGAVIFALLGINLIARAGGNSLRVAAVSIYVFGVVFALTASGIFHLLDPGSAARGIFRRIDHAGIFFLIAATYTPIHIIEFKGLLRWGVLAAVWLAAICGMAGKFIYFDSIPQWAGLSLYLGLGWAGLISATALYRIVGLAPLRPLIGGALAYTTGALLEFLQQPTLLPGVIGPHEVFHFFVLCGVAMHWTYIRRIVVYAHLTDRYQ